MLLGKTAIIGIGNRYRGDDGVGPELLERLRGTLPAGIALIEHDGEVASLVELLSEYESVLIIDAVSGSGKVGDLQRFDAAAADIPAQTFHGSTHALGLEDALTLAKSMGTLPQTCFVFGITGGDFEHRTGLSAELHNRLEQVTQQIRKECLICMKAP